MSAGAALWCMRLAALASLTAASPPRPHAPVDPGVTWQECRHTNHKRIVSRHTPDLTAEFLFVENCNITSLQAGSFTNLPNLKNLILESNNITHFDATLLAPLTKLTGLSLAKNLLLGKELPSNMFNNNRKLSVLDFSYNDMADTPFDLLNGLNELTILILEHCSLRRVPFLVTQPVLKKVIILVLTFNQIQRIDDPDTFSHLESLYNLTLSHNIIEYLHEDSFKSLPRLGIISLDNNRLRHIPEKLFHNHQFISINLSGNLIEYLPANAFVNTLLFELDISGNRLTYLPDTIYSSFYNVKHAGASRFISNPWQCACLNEILVQFKRRGIRYERSGLDGKRPVCQLADGPCIKNTRVALPYS